MRLLYSDILHPFDFRENIAQILVLESSTEFSVYVHELYQQVNGGDGRWILSELDNAYKFDKDVELIINPFAVDLNQKKLINTLYNKLDEITKSPDIWLSWNELYSKMVDVIEKQISPLEYDLGYSDSLEVKDFLKIMNLHFVDDSESVLEKLIDYVQLLHEVLNVRLFIFINIRSYLSPEDLQKLYKQVFYNKNFILLIENDDNFIRQADEEVIIIDKDHCIIF
ncbi:MAG: type II-A CRISPR-associated protein Csn2 [Erysipelotrichaceae bacterium]|nr:type II-A CRISPR-associated protein Csn2 [Erysipelotrichaceae bacterium]